MSSGYNTPMGSDMDDEDDILVIGIDFGTTFSGVAWATAEDFEFREINIITSWPGTGREEGKAPTELFYKDDKIMWGFDVPRDADPVRWFKLLLLKEEDLDPELRTSQFLFRARKMLKDNGKTAVDLIADYLCGLWTHTIATIEKARGKSVVDALQFRVVLTVPAIWKGYARQSMETAARQAGILSSRPGGETTLVFAPEPEAAALSTLCEKIPRPTPGEVFVICDAGGGTADLISYEVTGKDPIGLDEAVEGKGGLCGGIFVDEEFERICKDRLGRRWDRLSKAGIKEVMKGEWEYEIKPGFKKSAAKDTRSHIVSIPAEAFNFTSLDDMSRLPFIKNGRIHFSWADIDKAFKDTVAGIGALIDQQLNEASKRGKSVTGIILVGGFGASPYLYEYVQDRYAKWSLDVLQAGGIKPRTAICRGAVFKGFISKAAETIGTPEANNIVLPIRVNSTISRASFGTKVLKWWDEGQHVQEDKFWDDTEGVWKAQRQMDWYITRGDLVTEPVNRPYYRAYLKDPGPHFTVSLYQCEDEKAPSRKIKSVTKLCTIECELDVPFSSLPLSMNPSGEIYRKLNYNLEMVPSGASVEFSVYIDGRKQGGENVAIKFM